MRSQNYKRPNLPPKAPSMPGTGNDEFEDYAAPPKRKSIDETAEDKTFYGIPKLALVVICGNLALWACGLVSYWIGRLPVLEILVGMTFLAIGATIWLVVAYIQWRFFWWLLALSVSLTTLGLGYLYLMLLTGAAALTDLRLPRIVF